MTADDRDALWQIASDKRVWEQHPIHDRWQAEVFASFFDDAMRNGGALVAIDRQIGKIVGSSQYRATAFDRTAIEIGWTYIAPEYWGSGFNHDMKRLMLRHALESVPRVLFRVGESNWRSRKAMENIGGLLTEFSEEAEYRGRSVRHVVYEITRDSFAKGPLAR